MKRRIKLAFLFALLFAFWGCRPTEYLPIHDTTYAVREVHDSTYIDRWHTHTVAGDTVYIHDSIYESHVEWKHDTLRIAEEKPVEVPVIKEVEKDLSWLQRTLIYIGIASLAYLILRVALRWLKRYLNK